MSDQKSIMCAYGTHDTCLQPWCVCECHNGRAVDVRECTHDEELLNADAVAVKWYKCRKCDNMRPEYVKR